MSLRPLVLASASAARLRLLRDAGFAPKVVVSGVDEQQLTSDDPRALVLALAERKASTVADRLTGDELVIGCDSLLELDGAGLGKPSSAAQAVAGWHRMRGCQGVLATGQCVVDVATGRRASDVATTVVRFGTPSDREIEAYVATGEPLGVAGGFTLDGRSAPFVIGIDGDAGTVIGLSLPLLRIQLGRLDVEVTSLWC